MTPTSTDNQEASFEESLEKIRAIVADLEGGQLSLEGSIEKYREGSSLIEHARKLISDAELRISELGSTSSDE